MQRLRFLLQQDPVRRHGKVLHSWIPGKHPHQGREVPPQERFAAGEANPVYSKLRKEVHQPAGLLK
jgi:hypothetical protein